MLVIPPPPLIKVASNTRPYSKLGGTTLNGREEGGQYYISQTCDQERFEARKVVFSWECLNIFAIACSSLFGIYRESHAAVVHHELPLARAFSRALPHSPLEMESYSTIAYRLVTPKLKIFCRIIGVP